MYPKPRKADLGVRRRQAVKGYSGNQQVGKGRSGSAQLKSISCEACRTYGFDLLCTDQARQ